MSAVFIFFVNGRRGKTEWVKRYWPLGKKNAFWAGRAFMILSPPSLCCHSERLRRMERKSAFFLGKWTLGVFQPFFGHGKVDFGNLYTFEAPCEDREKKLVNDFYHFFLALHTCAFKSPPQKKESALYEFLRSSKKKFLEKRVKWQLLFFFRRCDLRLLRYNLRPQKES